MPIKANSAPAGKPIFSICPPHAQLRLPVREVEAQVRLRVDEVERDPHHADDNRDEGGDRRAADAHFRKRAPAENQERGEDHVDHDGAALHPHARLEIAGAAQRRAHRDHGKLQGHRRNKPQQELLGGNPHPLGRALTGRVLMAEQHRDGEEQQAHRHRQHLRLIEQENRALLILAARRVRHQRRRADAQHLGDRDHHERKIAAEANRADRVGAEASHPEQIDQDVERLEDHADEHEAGRLEEMSGEGTGREVLHKAV